jgi:uncharacterized membrane protein
MITALLAVAGLAVSFYIYWSVSRNRKLVCIIGKDCNAVVESKYDSLFGMRNEIMGMGYYGAVLVGSFFALPSWVWLAVSGFATVVSVLLLGIQSFVLRKWCEYCVASALITIAIFVVAVLS